MVTSAVGTPLFLSSASNSRAPGRHGTPSASSFCCTRSVSHCTISSGSRSTPRDFRMAAEFQSPSPTSSRPSSCVHSPPNECTSSTSDAIQYGSVSTRVPSMSQRTAAGSAGGFSELTGHKPTGRVRAYPGWMASDRHAGRGHGTRTVTKGTNFLGGRILVVAFEGWNDAGEAASGAVKTLQEVLDVVPIAEVDPELYFDYQFNRPTVTDDDGQRRLIWPSAVVYGPVHPGDPAHPLADDANLRVSGDNVGNIYLLLGTEPSRSWKGFTAEILDAALAADIGGIVFLGAMLADVPHTRPISI